MSIDQSEYENKAILILGRGKFTANVQPIMVLARNLLPKCNRQVGSQVSSCSGQGLGSNQMVLQMVQNCLLKALV